MLNTQKKERAVNLNANKGSAQFSQMRKPSQVEIANKAYELYEQRGCQNAQDWDDWFRAEQWCKQNQIK